MAKQELTWGPLDLFAELHWDYGRWLAVLDQDYRANRWYGNLYEYFERLIEETGLPPGSVWEMGFTTALRDTWQAVVDERQPESNDDQASTKMAEE